MVEDPRHPIGSSPEAQNQPRDKQAEWNKEREAKEKDQQRTGPGTGAGRGSDLPSSGGTQRDTREIEGGDEGQPGDARGETDRSDTKPE
jgi:hypothetical protein